MSQIHQNRPLEHYGALLPSASAVAIMVHGRGGGTESITPLISHLDVQNLAYLVPSAYQRTWYPNRFLAPRASNEPHLTSALAVIADLVKQAEEAGIPSEKIALLGFSQGACLALEFAIRNPRRYGAVIGLSGGLIGADDEISNYAGSLEDTPVFLGCSDIDDHIPLVRVHHAAQAFAQLGANVDARIYPNMGHTVNLDEMQAVKALLEALI